MATKPNGHAEGGNSNPQNDDSGEDYPIIGATGSADDGTGIPTIEPSEVTGSSDAPKRGRGRPRGSTSTKYTSPGKQKQAATDLTGILFSLHLMGSAFLGIEELELDQNESKRLSDAVNEVQAQYKMPILDPKTMAWINLAITGAGIYGPRVAAHSLRKKKEKQAQKRGQVIEAQPIKVM